MKTANELKMEFFKLIRDEETVNTLIANKAQEWRDTVAWSSSDIQDIHEEQREQLEEKKRTIRRRMEEIRESQTMETLIEWRTEFHAK